MNIPSFSPCVDDQKHRSPRVNITPNRYGRSLFLQEKERLQTILKKRIEISFLSNTGNVNTCSYTLKQLQDWLVNKMSVWSEQAEVFLVGSVAASVLQETHLSKDIDLRIMLPQTIVDTSKAEFLVTFFLRQYAPKTKQGSWRPIFTVHTAPDRTSCTYQMGAVDLNFRARVPAYLSVNKSDGFVIRLSDQHVFCIDQQTYCSTETSFQEGYHQLTQKIYSIAHFRNLRSIELRILKKATLGHLIPERDYFKEFLTRIQSDYYLADATGKLVAGWFGRKEWLSTYRKHLDTDYPASITGSERLRVYLLDILNLLACVGEVPPVFAERVSTVWRASLSGTRSSLTSPLYFLEHYPEETSLLLQLVQSIACCHYTYCIHEDRLLKLCFFDF